MRIKTLKPLHFFHFNKTFVWKMFTSVHQNSLVKNVHISASTLSNKVNEKIFSWASSEQQCGYVSWVFNRVLTQALHLSTCLQQMLYITGTVDNCWQIIQQNEFNISSRIAPKTLAVLFHSVDWLLMNDSIFRLIPFMSSAINAMKWTID